MFAFFISIVALSAGVFSGILFYVSPNLSQHTGGKGVKSAQAIFTPADSPSPSLFDVSPTATVTPDLTITPPEESKSLGTPTVTIAPTKTLSDNKVLTQSTLTPFSSPSLTETPILKTPTPTISTVTPTQTPTLTPKPTAPPAPSVSPTPASFSLSNTNSSPSGLNANVIFGLINNYRNSKGLPTFQKDETTCSVAAQRAPHVYDEVFTTHNMHAGFNAMHFDYWITENIISIDTEQAAVDWWLQDTIHRQVIEGDYKYSCVACSGNSCAEIFTSYIPK